MEELKFPTGKCPDCTSPNSEELKNWIKTIEDFPNELKKVTKDLTLEQLHWKYRPEGWTLKQVIHHCADSHMNSYIRFKLALTEETPDIRPYYEDRWAELPDSLNNDISTSITLLSALHLKWVYLLNTLSAKQLKLSFIHPEHGQKFLLDENIGIYAWHCNHHLSHIKNAILFKGKYN
ncbi:MAG: YfiT family bacillithiol transferase [Wenyingzhuangia sp.]|uniref:YfiT family bacillithiol transferase n=1 Tax=Wenyingzhuangia sp. TaxID=1964193 RepID=UPI00321A3892